jgi:hypothetical protein
VKELWEELEVAIVPSGYSSGSGYDLNYDNSVTPVEILVEKPKAKSDSNSSADSRANLSASSNAHFNANSSVNPSADSNPSANPNPEANLSPTSDDYDTCNSNDDKRESERESETVLKNPFGIDNGTYNKFEEDRQRIIRERHIRERDIRSESDYTNSDEDCREVKEICSDLYNLFHGEGYC